MDPMTFVILDCDCAVLVGISIHTGRDWGPPADVGEYVGVVDADDADICLCDACCSHSNAYYWNLALSRWFLYRKNCIQSSKMQMNGCTITIICRNIQSHK